VANLANVATLRALVLKRCKGYCEKCGRALNNDFALHHRKLRSAGGKDAVENFLALHHECHNLGTKSVHLNPKDSMEKGYIVSRYREPLACPLMLPDGSSVILTEEGTYLLIKEGEHGW
jgi:hypothetical protein